MTAWAFKAVPYAAPPTGDLRWKPPADAACFMGTLQASAFGPECAQLDDTGAVVGDENCLTLNVWTPKTASSTSPLPVLLFVPGGGNVSGGASQMAKDGTGIYDGANLATEVNAVVVTINYRLNVFGWLSHAELDAESPHGASGNYGTLDQIAALTWVQENAKAFGGDPTHVLLFGESAGGEDVCNLLASPLAKGLFAAAVMESGGCTAATKAASDSVGDTIIQAAGCKGSSDVLGCLRALPTATLVKALPEMANVAGFGSSFTANIDGYALTALPKDVISGGSHNHVPWIVGTNAKETNAAVPAMTDAEYTMQVNTQFGALASQVLNEYPISQYGTGRDAYVALTTDLKFVCGARSAARAAAKGQTEPVYRYVYTHALDNGSAAVKALGPYHGTELAFVFDHLNILGYVPTPAESALAKSFGSYWRNLGVTGSPNDAANPMWPAYDPTNDTYVALDDTITQGAGVRTAQCDFWETLFPTL